jgi:predicted lipoprotein
MFKLDSTRKWIMILWPAAACAVAIFYFLPLFHVVPLNVARQQSADGVFNPAGFVEKFWAERLLPSAEKAVDAGKLMAAVVQDRNAARKKYGRGVGLGDVYYFFVAGRGSVVSVRKDGVAIALKEGSTQSDIILETGNIFGNAVRDGAGLLNVNDFSNSRDFNDISSEINRRIERQVLPALRVKAVVGAKVRFAGCAEITDEDTDLRPLRIVPFIAEAP